MNNQGAQLQEKVFVKNEDIVTRKITGELFIVPVRGKLADMQRIFTLNPVAEYIWHSLDGLTRIEDIRKGILATYDVDEQQIDSDIRDFIAELLEADLIKERA
ncbi:MAG: PqqD family protein [Nitrospirae bacterium]|nr:PqqD family protein [Nitrospirota bacterium]